MAHNPLAKFPEFTAALQERCWAQEDIVSTHDILRTQAGPQAENSQQGENLAPREEEQQWKETQSTRNQNGTAHGFVPRKSQSGHVVRNRVTLFGVWGRQENTMQG